MNIVQFFKGIGHFLGRTFGILRKIVPEELLVQGIRLAQQAAKEQIDNTARREWVVRELMKLPMVSESTARLVTELAVAHLKADVIDKAAGKAIEAV
jgi:hypothetical protein